MKETQAFLRLFFIFAASPFSNMVAQRTREIGIRMALGSSTRQAMLEIGKSGIFAVALGMIGGLSLSAVSLQLIKSELHDVKTYDPATFSAVLVLLIFAALLATFLPTRRIARIDPGCHLAGGITSLAAKF